MSHLKTSGAFSTADLVRRSPCKVCTIYSDNDRAALHRELAEITEAAAFHGSAFRAPPLDQVAQRYWLKPQELAAHVAICMSDPALVAEMQASAFDIEMNPHELARKMLRGVNSALESLESNLVAVEQEEGPSIALASGWALVVKLKTTILSDLTNRFERIEERRHISEALARIERIEHLGLHRYAAEEERARLAASDPASPHGGHPAALPPPDTLLTLLESLTGPQSLSYRAGEPNPFPTPSDDPDADDLFGPPRDRSEALLAATGHLRHRILDHATPSPGETFAEHAQAERMKAKEARLRRQAPLRKLPPPPT